MLFFQFHTIFRGSTVLRHFAPPFPLNCGWPCVLGDGSQHRYLPRHQNKKIKILNISFPQVRIEPTTCRVYSYTLMPLRYAWPQYIKYN